MVLDDHGRILITGSIVGFRARPFSPLINARKAFINSFTAALCNEQKKTSVTVTCLMPGATDIDAFFRKGMLNTIVGFTE